MELSVINEIIFGTLQPWQVGNQNEQIFYDLLRTCTRAVPATVKDLNRTNQQLLRDHPKLYRPIAKNTNDTLPAPLYEIALPKPFNAATEYYSLLMQCTALQFMYELTNTIQKTTHDTEAYYYTNTALERIKYLTAGAAKELQRQEFSDTPKYQTSNTIASDKVIERNIHFILFTAKQITTILFFEVQERFKDHVRAIEIEEQFFLHTLQEAVPQQSTLKPTLAYYVLKVEQLIQGKEFSLDEARELLKQLNPQSLPNKQLINLQTALENYIFSNLFKIETNENSLASLQLPDTSNALFIEVRYDIETTISQLDKGYKRLNIINTTLDKIGPIPEKSTHSATNKLHKWLQQQHQLFTNLYNEKFPVEKEEPEAADQKSKAKISFGFTGDKAKLKNVIIELSQKVELLNEDRSSTDELLTLLTSKTIKPACTQIYLNCETVQFRYIIDKLKTYFTALTPKQIEKTECFYSKKGILMTSQNLYSNKIDTPKDQSTIDNIINYLH